MSMDLLEAKENWYMGLQSSNYSVNFHFVHQGRPGRPGFDGLPGYPGFRVSNILSEKNMNLYNKSLPFS